jgi:phosphatidylserine/phosphatidylglycerophosphate/cardiolipin synthase-like enzyme
VVTVGHHQLRFVDTQSNDNEPDEFEKTMVITPGSAVAAVAAKKASAALASPAVTPPSSPPPAPAAAKPAAATAASSASAATAVRPSPSAATGEPATALPKAKLQVLSGAFAGRELELNKALTTLGRPGVQVAAITRRADGYFIVHVDSGKPGDYPSVNGNGIGEQARKLNDNDVILLAGVKMGFFEN